MAKSKSKKYAPKTFESAKGIGDTSANIYLSMILSPAFQDLSSNAVRLYVFMKSQYYGQKNVKEYDELTEQEKEYDQTFFYFSYGLARDKFNIKNQTQFRKDINALIEHGFIRVEKNGKTTRKKSIYQFSDEWQTWEEQKDEQ